MNIRQAALFSLLLAGCGEPADPAATVTLSLALTGEAAAGPCARDADGLLPLASCAAYLSLSIEDAAGTVLGETELLLAAPQQDATLSLDLEAGLSRRVLVLGYLVGETAVAFGPDEAVVEDLPAGEETLLAVDLVPLPVGTVQGCPDGAVALQAIDIDAALRLPAAAGCTLAGLPAARPLRLLALDAEGATVAEATLTLAEGETSTPTW